jgi:hypothetical protein
MSSRYEIVPDFVYMIIFIILFICIVAWILSDFDLISLPLK